MVLAQRTDNNFNKIDPNAVVLVRGSCRCGALRPVALHFKVKCCSCVPAVIPGLLCARDLCQLEAPVACCSPAGRVSAVSTTTVYNEAEKDNNTSTHDSATTANAVASCCWKLDHCRRISVTFVNPTLLVILGYEKVW